MSLTDFNIRNAKPNRSPQKLADGGNLYLLVSPAGGKLWRLNYRYLGKQKTVSLGSYPDVTPMARERQCDSTPRPSKNSESLLASVEFAAAFAKTRGTGKKKRKKQASDQSFHPSLAKRLKISQIL